VRRGLAQSHQGDHVFAQIGGRRGIASQLRQGARARQGATLPCLGLRIERQGFLGISQRRIHVITGGEAAGKIGKPHAGCLIRPGVFDDGKECGMCAVQSGCQPACL
jgi:hypothetical protein